MSAGNLDGKWTLDYWPQGRVAVTGPEEMEGVEYSTVEATVPGNVELDLVAAGLLPEPEIGGNYELLRPYEGYQWRYSRNFTTPESGEEDSVILKFEGLDTFAEIYINGEHVGSAANMLIEHSFDVTDFLSPAGGDNTLEVYLRSSVIEGRKQLPPAFSNNWQRPETVFMRRAPHTYGWDIMPRIVSAGIWRGVDLRVEGPVHFEDVHWMTGRVDRASRSAHMMVDYMVSLPPKYQQDSVDVHVKLSRNGKVAFEKTAPIAMYSERVRIYVEDIDLWWPRGYGEPALYEGLVELVSKRDGSIIDSDTQKVGIRTILLERDDVSSKDKPGKFCFIVNGEPIYMHGSNWTPLDAFHSRDPQWMERTMDLVTDLNCNMIRCWGGGVYESDEFFDLCAEKGVLVWQDFAMGCSFYPQSTAFQLKLEEEIYAVVKRLRRHTAIALWAGNNEDDAVILDGNFSYYKP
ncbi:MAG: glycoside hydrolase family 2, partial [Bacteroidales bacterium]|nr:glycoside hydrolase family 2 [Bacteroidales bacterium]